MPKDIEGGSITHLLKGKEQPVTRSREGLVFHFPHYQGDAPHSAIIKGDFKLIHHYETETSQLFNLVNDLRESKDLSSSMPEKAAAIETELLSRLHAIGADFPEVNPQYDPNNPPNIRRGGGGGQRDREARGNRGGGNRGDRENREGGQNRDQQNRN